MSTQIHRPESKNIFLRMHPLQRILISLLAAVIVFFIIRKKEIGFVLCTTTIWDAFAFTFIIICWIVFFKRSHAEIIKQANKDDGSRVFVLISILVATFASMAAVFLLLVSKGNDVMTMTIAVTGMVLSWIMVHTIFTFHYAHMYYAGYKEDKSAQLDFPGDIKPDYLDFAYFSFVIGMTFQVSDVVINSQTIRRTVLAHSLLAFVLNTFVVALTISVIGGLGS
jgi:uncharacterized membrane protein